MLGVEQIGSEYLSQKNWESPYLDGMPKWQELIDQQSVYSPRQLVLILQDARRFLSTEPGEHLRDRQKYSQEWLGWWIEYFERNTTWRMNEVVSNNAVSSIDNVRQKLLFADLRNDSGLLTGAGMEGTPGHLSAIDHMAKNVRGVVIGLEQDSYMLGKPRKYPLLNLAVRLSMWAQHPKVNVVTVLPEKSGGVETSLHYLEINQKMGTRYSFGSADDPYLSEKIRRGDKADFLVIPNLDSPRTSDRVRRLLDSQFSNMEELFELSKNLSF